MVSGLLGILIFVLWILIWVIIIQAIFSWLVAFNVVNTYNNGVRMFLYWLERITDPLYRPVRAIMPDFGGIDFSPIVVILVLNIAIRFLSSLQLQAMVA